MIYRFEDFSLDTARRELRQREALVAVEPQVFDMLRFLIEARERVVSRDDLLEAVWHGRIVSEATLSSRLNAARNAIGDTGTSQRLIRTLPRKGVRFVGEVREVPDQPERVVLPPLPASPNVPRLPGLAVLPFIDLSGRASCSHYRSALLVLCAITLDQRFRFKQHFLL